MTSIEIVAAYAIILAALVAGQWLLALGRRRVPELESEPRAIRLHLAAEFGMAAALLGGGALTLAGAVTGPMVVLAAFGGVIYSVVNSAGYFADRGEWPPVVMFAILFVLTGLASLAIIGELT